MMDEAECFRGEKITTGLMQDAEGFYTIASASNLRPGSRPLGPRVSVRTSILVPLFAIGPFQRRFFCRRDIAILRRRAIKFFGRIFQELPYRYPGSRHSQCSARAMDILIIKKDVRSKRF